MAMKKLYLLPGLIRLVMLVLPVTAMAQSPQKMTVEAYIGYYSALAVNEMRAYGIPASITMAQGILESGSGNSELARKANNHFGIKCHTGWEGKTFHMDDDRKNECFRKYSSPEDSYRDHSIFLTTRSRYASLFNLPPDDYKGWAKGLKEAGYATNPRYPDLLIRIIEENRLYMLDQGKFVAKAEGQDDGKAMKNELPEREVVVENPGMFRVDGAPGGRTVYLNNGIKFVIAREGETVHAIAAGFGIYSWQVKKYNELDKDDRLVAGEMVYLERKKNKGGEAVHTVGEGEGMLYISQLYGIRLKSLYRMNRMETGAQPAVGSIIRLK